jgi:hypothetical protein
LSTWTRWRWPTRLGRWTCTPASNGQVYEAPPRPAPQQPGRDHGRALPFFNRILPDELRFVNETLDKGALQDLVANVLPAHGREATTELVRPDIKDIGFHYATRSGVTIAIADLTMPRKKNILEEAGSQVAEVERSTAAAC